MRILVSGIDGFVGRHLAARLLTAGHELVGLTEDGAVPHGVRPVRADIRDHHVLLRAVEQAAPDAALHLAAVSFLPAVRRDPRAAFEINAGGTLALLLALAEAAPGARAVVISSSEVYGEAPAHGPLDEDRPLAPVSLYGASKAAAEHLARALAAEGQDVVVLRPFNHIGPGQRPEFVVPSFARQIAELERAPGGGRRVLRHGNLDAVRDFLDVRDVVRAYELALTARPGTLRRGAAYNVCSGRGVRIAEIVRLLLERARVAIELLPDPERLRTVDVRSFVGDPGRLGAAVGFAPQLPLERTLDDVLAEARAAVSAKR